MIVDLERFDAADGLLGDSLLKLGRSSNPPIFPLRVYCSTSPFSKGRAYLIYHSHITLLSFNLEFDRHTIRLALSLG